MTAPELPEWNGNPHFKAPREICTHQHTVVCTQNVCAIERSVRVCTQCGVAVE
jgi:hypothetical protein